MASKGYNGHKNWNHWNVSLWLSNDEPLYRFCRRQLRFHTKDEAARRVLHMLKGGGTNAQPCTPDGAPYTFTAIRVALAGDF